MFNAFYSKHQIDDFLKRVYRATNLKFGNWIAVPQTINLCLLYLKKKAATEMKTRDILVLDEATSFETEQGDDIQNDIRKCSR